MLAVQPTVELAKRFSQQRVDPLIEESPVLREKVAPARSRDSGNTVLSKEFPGGILVMTGANSAVGLRSMPVRYPFLDEVDAYPLSADEEGEPVALAEARTRTFSWRRKVFLVSTPTVKGLQPHRARVRGLRSAPLLPAVPAVWHAAVAEVPTVALGMGAARDRRLRLRGLRRQLRRGAQDADAGRRRLARHRPRGGSGHRRLPHLGALLAARLVLLAADRPRLGGVPGQRRGEAQLQEHRAGET